MVITVGGRSYDSKISFKATEDGHTFLRLERNGNLVATNPNDVTFWKSNTVDPVPTL